MEDKKFASLEREDRGNDLDDIDLGEFQFDPTKDYKDYLREVKEQQNSVRTKPEKKKKMIKKQTAEEEEKEIRSIRVAFMTTEDIAKALRMIAAANGKTVSTLINDLIKAALGTEIDKVINSGLIQKIRVKKI